MADFGSTLRTAREQRGISIRDIADRTKIARTALEALENGDLSRLPGGIFVRAFIRAYATEVGLDPENAVREFLQQTGDRSDPVLSSRVPEEESAFENNRRVASVLLRIAAVSVPLIVLTLYFTLRQRSEPAVRDSARSSVVSAPVSPAAGRPDSPAAAAPLSATPNVTQPLATATSGQGGMTLVVRATAACWTEIAIDGRRALRRTLMPGDTETLEARESVVIRVGNAAGLAFSINGREAKPLGASGEVRSATITRASMAAFLR
jgi:cytoskeletal protein RodZ